MVEQVFQVRVVDSAVAHVGSLCRRGHHGVANLRPGGKVIQCGIALAIGRLGQRLRLGHCLAVDNLPVVLAKGLNLLLCGSQIFLCGLHHWYGLVVDKMPCTGLLAVHQIDHFALIGLVVLIYIIPAVTGNGVTVAIGSPTRPCSFMPITVKHPMSFRPAVVVDTL